MPEPREPGAAFFRRLQTHCWVRQADSEIFCAYPVGHPDHCAGYGLHGPGDGWSDDQCAPDAGPGGRETTAYQILELSWHADFVAFRRGEGWGEPGSPTAPRLRAIAARLRVDTRAALADFERVVRDGRALLAAVREPTTDALTAATLSDEVWLLQEVAQRLQFFAGVPQKQGLQIGGAGG
jgi:hypothetical protein